MVQALMLRFLSNNTVELAEVDALYNGVQALMSGQIPHFILSHRTLLDALNRVQGYLDRNQPHLVLSRFDHSYYYLEANFKTFRKGNTLVLILDAPVTKRVFSSAFQLYELVKLPLLTPEPRKFYTMLATNIKIIGFSRDSEYLIQILDNSEIPHGTVWHAAEQSLVFLDRAKLTCARALIEGQLSDIKSFCRYNIHKAPVPRGIIRLYANTFLLTNISILSLHCLSQDFNATDQITYLTDIQTIQTFDCNCDRINADEFRIVADLDHCNDSNDISTVYDIHFPINLAYLSHYFGDDQLFNLTADAFLNYSVAVQLPNLAVADKILDEQFAHEKSAAFDMEQVINSTKQSGKVYDNLATYLFNEMIKAHDSQGGFDLLSPYTWISILMWIASGFALVMVVLLQFKVRSLTMLMMTRTAHAAAINTGVEIPKILTLTTTTSVTQSTVDVMSEWIRHVKNVPNLIPVEVLISACLIMLFLFKVGRMIYLARRKETARTRLVLELGNAKERVLLPIINLPHTPNSYRFVISKSDVEFRLFESIFSAELLWNAGITLSNTALDMPIFLSPKLKVRLWDLRKLRFLLLSSYYAAIQIISGSNADCMEIVVLRNLAPESYARSESVQPLYPYISSSA